MVEVNIHGILAEKINRKIMHLSVSSVGEAVRAIESNTRVLYKNLYELDKKNIKYRILINNQDFKIFKPEEEIKNDFDKVINSNLFTKFENEYLKSIDIIPIIQGSGSNMGIFAAILGVALAFTGVGLALTGVIGATFAAGLILGGIGLAAVGFLALLSSPPPYVAPEFSAPDVAGPKGGGGKAYLFDGPTNTAGEGGPIPIGYGRLVVGSKTISASFNTTYIQNTSNDPAVRTT
jgi:predicted phage tail protein